jgi:hypothetical protein
VASFFHLANENSCYKLPEALGLYIVISRRLPVTHPNSPTSLNRRTRPALELETILDCRLKSYVIAAKGAVSNWNKTAVTASALTIAGVALLASTSAEAEVVYTPADIHVYDSRTGVKSVSLDINNDGQPDFRFQALWGESFSSGNDVVYQTMKVYGNVPSNQGLSTRGDKAALRIGAPIGPEGKFGPNPVMAVCDDFNGRRFSSGQWINVSSRYLGVKFQIDGETHYGWVRMNVNCNNATITGYAYETIANQPLRAGVLPSANDSGLDPATPTAPGPKATTLGALAAGALGLSAWRGE